MGLKFFNKDTYDSIGDAFKAIKQELLSLCPKDSSSIRWQRGIDGMSATIKEGQSAADEGSNVPEESTPQHSGYNGYFTIKDVSTYNEDGTVKEYRVAVCDGETWDPEKLTSGDSIAYCMGNNITFKSTVLTLTENIYIYIKCGPANTYLNKIIAQVSTLPKPSRVGYEYILVGTVSIVNKQLTIIQRLRTGASGGALYVPYTQYAGPLSLRVIETEDDGIVNGKIAVCDGETWDAAKQISEPAPFSAGQYFGGGQIDCTIIDCTADSQIYLHAVKTAIGIRGEIIATTEYPDVTPGTIEGFCAIGYGTGKQFIPYQGLYNVWMVNTGCINEQILEQGEEI